MCLSALICFLRDIFEPYMPPYMSLCFSIVERRYDHIAIERAVRGGGFFLFISSFLAFSSTFSSFLGFFFHFLLLLRLCFQLCWVMQLLKHVRLVVSFVV